MSVVWRNETVLSLIELYQSHDLLWDTSNPDYRNRIKKHEAWEDIAKTINLPRKEIEGKIHTLRSQFIRERKKKTRKTTVTGEELISQWFAYDAMKFLQKEETSSGTLDTMDSHSSHSQDMTPRSPESHSPWMPDHLESQSLQQTPTPSSSRTTRKRTQYNENNLEEDYEDMDAAKNRRLSRDEFDVYGQYVGSELRSLNDEHSIIMAKHYINNILTDARLGKYSQSHTSSTQGSSTFKRDPLGF